MEGINAREAGSLAQFSHFAVVSDSVVASRGEDFWLGDWRWFKEGNSLIVNN